MVKRFAQFFCAIMCAGGLGAQQVYREKTFVSSFAPEQTRALLWTNLMQQIDMVSKKRLGGRVQATTSVHATNNDSDFARYFGMFNPMRNAVESFVGIDQQDPNELLSSMNFIHDYARASSTYAGYGVRDKIAFNPEKKTLALSIDYVHGFDLVCEGLSLRISVPFVRTKTSMNPQTIISDARGMNLPGIGTHVTVSDYLAGTVENKDPSNLQAALKKLKITRGFSEVKGMSDVEIALRMRLWSYDSSHLDIGLKAIVPVASQLKGDFLFEPTCGNGGHRGIGGELLLDFLAYEQGDINFEVVFNVDYSYLFPADEMRVPLFKDKQGNIPSFAAYQLGGKVGVAGMFPMANLLANMFKISPGHKIETTLSCVTSCQGLVFEFGAGAKGRSQEKVEILTWQDDSIGLVRWGYNANNPVTTADLWSTASLGLDGVAINAPSNARTINRESLDLNSITTPSMLTGYLFAFAGYSYSDLLYPLSFGLGMLREMPFSSNASPASWSFMFKLGMNF